MQQFETAQFLPVFVRPRLSGELVCYARAVRAPGMAADGVRARSATPFNPWGVAMFRTIATVEPKSASEQTAFDKWFDQTIRS